MINMFYLNILSDKQVSVPQCFMLLMPGKSVAWDENYALADNQSWRKKLTEPTGNLCRGGIGTRGLRDTNVGCMTHFL